MKPAWDKLMDTFKNSEIALVADVDCTADGKDLCTTHGIRGYPTIKYGTADELKDYTGGRDFDELKKFADDNLGPICGPANVNVCDEETRGKLERFLAMSSEEIMDARNAAEIEVQKAFAKVNREWTVHIEREAGTLLGAGLEPWSEHFRINKLQEGAIQSFNAASPDDAIRVGDQIKKVNSAIGTDAMKEEFKKNPVDLFMKREASAEEKVAAMKASGKQLIESVLAFKEKVGKSASREL